uniref:Hypothetical chloroplast RF1 n=1 Tax=Cephalotus follicularis TaxID=3775 RepID=A0A4Y5QKC1_CEPFO|nr:hypothetical chloroplast RF1 [Cephalotus follicularis]QCX32054.1 hypothetical chloroplast RF1 [Cephalotus follicularis]UZT28355.1 hypothetical protein RF1 [Cephalotus follicularis]
MILKSFLLGNLVSLCMKIINSVVVVGLYYGFLTTFSIGPSYLFLLRARVMEEGTEKTVSATTGFITGQLMMFISIYYAPLHLALDRPHTITVLALPYLLFHFFWNNHKHFFDYGSTTRNSMRNLSIQCVFLNNLIFQLFNHFILPSSMLVRLVNIYMFRCNNKMLFVTSSFVGWLIGHILFMKWVGLVLVWIQQNNSIRSNKYLVSELRNSMARIFSILLFITCVYYLGKMPSPIFTKKLKETSETEERGESEEETDVEIETTSETKGNKQGQEGSIEEDPSPSLFSEEKEDPDKIDETEEIRMNGKEKTKDEFNFKFKETYYKNRPDCETFYLYGNQENSKLEIFQDQKNIFWLKFEKSLVTVLFDSNRWNHPFRYIKNDQFENAVRNEMSQYFFYTCRSDGKERISFTYPPSLSTFLEMIQKKMFLLTTKKLSSTELYNRWSYNNKQKQNNLSSELINRVKNLDKGSFALNALEKRTRLCNDETQKKYLPEIYDPFMNGPYRGRIKKWVSHPMAKKSSIKNYIKRICINKIHGISLITNYRYFEQKLGTFHRKLFSREIYYFLNLISEFPRKSNLKFKRLSLFPEHEQTKIDLEDRDQIKFLKFLFETVISKQIKKKYIQIKEISKKVPQRSYKLINDLEQQERENEENVAEDHGIRSRKAKRVVIFTDNQQNTDNNTTDSTNTDQADEVALIRYSQQSDFRRDIIKGSMRAQRRKMVTWELFQANVHSPLFFDRIETPPFFSFDISEVMKIMFINWIRKKAEFTISDYTEKKTNKSAKKEEDTREEDKKEEWVQIEIAEAWDSILFAQVIRGFVLVTQSNFRKYILLPSLIIAKNIIRMLLFKFPEWSEDLKDWNREMHVKCTYNGVQLSETEFPKNWLTDGIQIKILFPFRLKPWHKSKLQVPHKDTMKTKEQKNDFCFLTVWGMEAELPFGSPRKRLSLFHPILKTLKKKIIKLKKKYFLVISFLKERKKKLILKSILVLKEILKEISKINKISLFGFIEIYELNETKKESKITHRVIHKSSIQFRSMDCYSLTKKKIKDLTDRTTEILNQIEKITKDKNKKKGFRIPEININSNKISYGTKGLRSSKNILQIWKRRNVRLVHKEYYFTKIFIERIYIDILLYIINIPNTSAQLFLESTRKIFDKYINEKNHERIYKKNQNTTHFISTIRELLSNSNMITNKSKIFISLSSLSQAYVFYKILQSQVIYLYKLRSIVQYHGTSFFLKNEIKDYFRTQEISHSKLKHKKLRNSVMNQWKNCLRSDYHYDLSQSRWSRLITHKWRNKVNQHCMTGNKDLNKWNSYEKYPLIHYEKQNNFEADSLLNQKEKFKKHYKYDLLTYKSINYKDKKNSYICGALFQVTKNQNIFYNYNYSTCKHKLFDILGDIPVNNYLGEDYLMDMEKNLKNKYFFLRILNFCLKKKANIKSWIDIGTQSKKNTKTRTNNSKIIDKIDTKDLFYLTIHQDQELKPSNQKKTFFDWMGMNEEILSQPISNLQLWLFQKFLIPYDVYKIKPRIIPIKLLFFNFNRNVSENKNINRKKREDLFISSYEKKSLELENRNQEEEENFVGSESDMKKRRKKKQYKSNTEAKLDFFLKRYLRFQLRWDNSLNQKIINNIKVYCLLLRLINPKEIVISSIEKGELSLDILIIQKDLTLTELMTQGILIIEPIRLSIKNDGQFFIFQTIGSSLIHKSKHKINQKYQEKSYNLLVPENILVSKCRRELRILISFNSKHRNDIDINTEFCNENKVKNYGHVLDDKSKHLDRDKNKLIKLKFFLSANYRLEDLTCMNRYWFDTNNGSRFSMIRMHMYPRLKIC